MVFFPFHWETRFPVPFPLKRLRPSDPVTRLPTRRREPLASFNVAISTFFPFDLAEVPELDVLALRRRIVGRD